MTPFTVELIRRYTEGVKRAREEYALHPFLRREVDPGQGPKTYEGIRTAKRRAAIGASAVTGGQTGENRTRTEAVPSGVGSTSGDLTHPLIETEKGGC